MSRESSDELAPDGTILHGFDYAVQVWVENGVCLDVGSGRQYAGQRIADVPGHEVRSLDGPDGYMRVVPHDAVLLARVGEALRRR